MTFALLHWALALVEKTDSVVMAARAKSIINLFLNFFAHSFFASLGILMLVVLYAINQLTLISGTIVLLFTFLFIKLF